MKRREKAALRRGFGPRVPASPIVDWPVMPVRPIYTRMTGLLKNMARAAAIAAVLVSGPAMAGSGKVVVELFTSQGCSSCPPADKLLGELAARDDVIALSFHVDYWNYLGWNDPFSSAASTSRQSSYRAAFGLRYVYTPQMVIGGAAETTGSRRGEVLRDIERIRANPQVGVDVSMPDKKTAIVRVAAGKTPAGPATVWLFAYDRRHSTPVRRGENSGAMLVNTHVVRAIRKVGEWTGRELEITLPIAMMGLEDQDGCAVVVQSTAKGQIYGAAEFPLMEHGS